MSKNRIILASMTVVLGSILMFGGASVAMEDCKEVMNKVEMCYDKEDGVYRIFSENKENFVVVADRNLGADEYGANGYIYQWGNNYGFSEKNFKNTKELAIRNNKFNNIGYNLGDSFVVRTEGDYWSNKGHHDGLWGGADDGDENQRGMNLIKGRRSEDKTYDVYDVDIFRQGPCPEGFHVPSYGDWRELLEYLSKNGRDISELGFPKDIVYRDLQGEIRTSDSFVVRTSSPIHDSEKAIAVAKNGDRVDIPRSMGLQVRCFQNKRDAMVGVTDTGSDVVFYDTEKPSILKGDNELSADYELLDGVNNTEFRQPVNLSDYVKLGEEGSHVYLYVCTGGENSLDESDLTLSGINTNLQIQCLLNRQAISINPWNSNTIKIEVVGDVKIEDNNINTCLSIGSLDETNTIRINVADRFIGDHATNHSDATTVPSYYLYAPTHNKFNNILWNYIYTGIHDLNHGLDGDNFIITDDELIRGWDMTLLSAEKLNENDIVCSVVSQSTGAGDLSPTCKVVSSTLLDSHVMGIINSCGYAGCESQNCSDGKGCWWNNSDAYKKILAPFKWTNSVRITGTTGTYYLNSGDFRTIKISLKDNRSTLGCGNDGTNSTYVKLKFKKIISPYKAGYLSGDDGGVRYRSGSLGRVINDSGTGEVGFKWYISNVQTIKSGNMSGGALGKVNYMINLSQPVADENYNIGGEATVGDYRAEINIQRPTSDNEENPDAYKSRFPSY